jgi:tetratricopeptide (TPR) repeat protein
MQLRFLAVLSALLMAALPLHANAQPSNAQKGGGQQGNNQQSGGQRVAAISVGGYYLAGRVAEQDHDYDGGASQFDQALAQSPDDQELIYSAFRLRLYAGRFDDAIKLAPSVLATRPGDGFANLVLAIQEIKKADYRGAEQQLGHIGTENQLGPLRDYVMAWLKVGEKEFSSARQILSKLKPESGERSDAPALIIGAEIDELAGEGAAAEAKYRKVIELDPTGLRSIMLVADGLRRLGKADEARALLKSYGEKYSDSVVMDGALAANAPKPRPLTPASGIADILFDIGSILGSDPRAQRTDLALIFELLAVELKPDFDFAWLTISGIYEQFGLNQKAAAALGKIGPSSPLSWQARLRIAVLDAQDDRFEQAVTRLRGMIAEKSDRIDAALTLADLLRGKERFADAVSAYDVAVSRLRAVNERYWPIYFGRGICLERVKQWPKAEADMKKALEISPDQPYVLNYLGYSWVDQGVNLDEGMRMLKRATELRPDDGAITDSVGWAYYRLGQFETAVDWLERASEQKGDDATVVEHLGDAYWHVGRKREARFEWQRALDQKPDKDRIGPLQDKLANGLSAANDKPTVYEKSSDKKQGG